MRWSSRASPSPTSGRRKVKSSPRVSPLVRALAVHLYEDTWPDTRHGLSMVGSADVHEEWVVVPSTRELVDGIILRTKRFAKTAFNEVCVRTPRHAFGGRPQPRKKLMPAGGRAAVLTHGAPACAAAAAAVCAVVALASCVLRIANASHAIHAGPENTFPRYGYCEYHFFWPRLGALGELIVQSHLQSETPERAWERWLASSTAAASSFPARGLTRFNGTWADFQRLWALRPCPPGPCGPLGQRCPPHFEGFECGGHVGDRYCCDAQGCFHDRCDNDGCFPGYVPCDAAMCGRPGQCACEVQLRPWRWDFWRGSGGEEFR